MKEKVSIALDHDVIEAVDKLSAEVARSRSDTINLILKRVMENKEIIWSFRASGGTAVSITEKGPTDE